MDNLRSSWLRRSGTFWAGALLVLLALFPWTTPAEADAKTVRGRQASVQRVKKNNKVNRQRSNRRWIEIDLSSQRLIAWEGRKRVYSMRISSGKRSTPTRIGTFRIQSKHRSTRMRGRGYNIAKVPYTMYYSGGYAIHGAFWHNRFGRPVSHGCVNLPVGQARKLFSWAPHGTKVVVHR